MLIVLVGVLILILHALDIVKGILVVLWAQRLAVFIIEKHQYPIKVVLIVAVDIEKVANIVFELLLYQYWIQVLVVVSSNAEIPLRIVQVIRR